ncbi:SgcJ/EcaC family oxidoreductase [Streptomyces liangshanensis]|uniref:SgcJ/EcaC family oxidoreductase n=1 Tax=Streptomyces liangshanensis TaxID=2717324 RepID=A0A6G9GTX4_9ACTN|nr:SgcJ/EcaC family oxidoreductase [Streptomyces liangshanensis]QIQ01509.1 SgcJ/EcaC family oxidoreductase [Streptomyces liangshanensis]
MTDDDADAVRALWRLMADGWRHGDAEAFGSVFTEDVAFVSVRGEELRGRAAVVARHAWLFAGAFRSTRLIPDIRLVRPVGGGLTLVHVVTAIEPDGPSTHAQALVAAEESGHRIAAFHNMTVTAPQGEQT